MSEEETVCLHVMTDGIYPLDYGVWHVTLDPWQMDEVQEFVARIFGLHEDTFSIQLAWQQQAKEWLVTVYPA